MIRFLLALSFSCAVAWGAESTAQFGLSGRVTIIRARARSGSLEQAGDSVKIGLRDDAGAVVWVQFEGDDATHGHRNQFQIAMAGSDARYLEMNSPDEVALLALLQTASTNSYGTSNPELLIPPQLEEDADYSRLGLASLFSTVSLRDADQFVAPALPSQSLDQVTLKTFLGGPESIAIVTNATEARVFRIIDNLPPARRKHAEVIDGFFCDAQSLKVTGGATRNSLMALCDLRNFGRDLKCRFDPSVIFRFSAAAGSLDVVVCFRCSEISLYRDGKAISRGAQGVSGGKNTFGAGAETAFVALAKKAFPKDPEISALKDR
jgi:hypothetical protein